MSNDPMIGPRERQGRSKQELDLRSRALRLLGGREFATHELERRLGDTDDARQIVAQLRDEGAQSDERFVEAYVRSRILRGQGPLRIRAELRMRQIDEELIARFLTRSTTFWIEQARRVLQRRRSPAGESPEGEAGQDDDVQGNADRGRGAESSTSGAMAAGKRLRLESTSLGLRAARLGRLLAQRGFPGDVISQVLNKSLLR